MYLLGLFCLVASGGEAGAEAPPEFKEVRAFIKEKVEQGEVASVAVAAVKGGKTVWAEGFGKANIEAGTDSTPDTIYRLASISKPMTATGLMVLVDRGKIDLDAPANRYLPGSKLAARIGLADAMTVRRLANHTSGLPLHYNFFYDGHKPTPVDETIRRYGFAATEPGKAWKYSNLAYGLLGHITEVVSGTPWGTFMEREVYDPAGMSRTSDRVRPGREAEAAVPYSMDASGRFVAVGDYDFDHPGASAVWSSANDLARFARMHMNSGEIDGARVLSERSTRAMQEPTGSRSSDAATGVSWLVTTDRGHRCLSHTGGMPGVSTALKLYPDDKAAVVVLINSETDGLNTSIARRLTRAIFPDGAKKDDDDKRPPAPKEVDIPSDWAGSWVGKLAHPRGDISLKMELLPPRTARVALGTRAAVELDGVVLREGRLEVNIAGSIPTRADYHGPSTIDFELDRNGDRLTGVGSVVGPDYFALSHWVELKKEAKDQVAGKAAPSFDLLLKNARIVDGCGTPWYRADLGIREGKIAAIGKLGDAKAGRVIDADGFVIAPGFIDMMGQTAAPFLTNPRGGDNLLSQGITTINAGEGESDAPLAAEAAKKAGWSSMAEFFAKLDQAGMPMNMVQTVGHTQVRKVVIGDVDRQATPAELAKMKDLVREGMEAGAIGVSTSLIYPPAVFASAEEIIELTKVAGEHGGGYFTHMRNEGDRLLEAIEEALMIGDKAGTPVHIFHLKAAGRANWPKMEQAIARIKAARAAGKQVGADIYPYVNNGLGLAAFIHPRHSAGGNAGLLRELGDPKARAAIRQEMETQADWENWYRHMGRNWDKVVIAELKSDPYKAQDGRPLGVVARNLGKDPWDVFFDAVKDGAFALPETMSEANKIAGIEQEFMSFCTDAGPVPPSITSTHPRAYGSFPRILSHYVRELGVLTLEQAIARMTSVAANELGIRDRGRISPGMAADLVVFDPDRIGDRATLAESTLRSEGIRFVLVNGQVVMDDGNPTKALPGRVLRGPGARGAH